MALVIKNWPASAGDKERWGLITGSWRSLGGRHGNLLQYSCLDNPMDRGAWQTTVHRVAKSWNQLSDYAHTFFSWLALFCHCLCSHDFKLWIVWGFKLLITLKYNWYYIQMYDIPLIIIRGKLSCFWRRQWHRTPTLLPGKSLGQRRLVGCSPWGH